MNIPILRTNKITGNDNRLEIEANIEVKGSIRASSLTVNDQPLGDIINNTAKTAAVANKLYTWIKYSEFSDGSHMTDKPTINSNYIGFSYNQPIEQKGTNPKSYAWTLITGKSALQYYTWMKYATGPSGEGITDTPTDNTYTYLGLAYNQLGMTESSDPNDYTWTKFVGPQGVTGPNGYTWIKYAPNNNPTVDEITDNPVGMDYIGMSYNNEGMTESGNPDDYKPWLLYKGATGLPGEVGATGGQGPATYTWMKYATGPSGQGINDTPIDDTYLYLGLAYNKLTQTESDNPSDYVWTKFVGPQGVPGIPTYTWMKYATGPSGEGLNDSPLDSTYIYIGLAYNKTSQTESTNPTDYSWTKFIGPQGIVGQTGADGKPTYTWIKYASDINGTGLTDSPVGMDYIGMAYNKLTQTESTTPSDYVWALYKGATGVAGPTLYTWMKYASSATGTGMTDNPVGMSYIGLAYNKTTPTKSTVASDYAWSLYKGTDGLPGPAGAPGVSVIMAASNFTFTADFDGTISSSAYSQATSSITVLDGVNVVYYSPYVNSSYDARYLYDQYDNNGSFVAIICDTYDLGDLSMQSAYDLLNPGEWLLYTIEGTGIQLSDYTTGIIPSTDRDYATTVAPINMSTDMASLKFTIIGKTYAGATFSFQQGQTFSKASVGPGIVYRGPFATGATYYASAKRRDVVYNTSSSNYWTASNLSKNGLKTWSTPSSSNSDWTVFAAEFSSIATGVIISEESYVKNTLNVGTNASGSAGNITLYGGNQYPFISLGQSTIGYGNSGFWLGATSATGSYLLSIGDNNNYLRWTGTGLQIKGAIDITSSSSIASKTDLSGATAAANSYADNKVNNLVIGGRNLFKKTSTLNKISTGGTVVKVSDYLWNLTGANGDPNVVFRISNVISSNGYYTVSFDLASIQGQTSPIVVDICDNAAGEAALTSDNLYHRVSFTANVQNYGDGSIYNFVDINCPHWVYYLVKNIKVEKGNKATDWTPAPEDVDAAILVAQTGASAANSLLADIAADNKLTASEKTNVSKEWNDITNEFYIICGQADAVNVTQGDEGPRDAYENSYYVLNNYIPTLSLGSTSTYTIPDVSIFKSNFANYYSSKVNLLSTISSVINYVASTANTTANNASSAITNLKIGGRNLIPNSLYNIDFNDYGGRGRTVSLTKGSEYTFSANGNNANALNNKVLWVILYKPDWSFQQNLTFNSAVTSTKSSTFTAPYTGNYFIDCYYADVTSPRTGSVRFNWCKLELGNRATDWTPAQEDIDASISAAQTSATAANALLADIASDSKFTPNEKIVALKEWNTILAEKPIITEQASSAGLFPSTDYSGYNDRDHYEFYYTGLYLYITPLLAGMTSTSDINGAVFRTTFSNYYTARTNMLNAIANSISTPALNLLSNSSQFTILPNWASNGSTISVDTTTKYNGYNTFKIVGAGGAYNTEVLRLDPNTTYTYSAFVKSSENYTGGNEDLLHVQNWTVADNVSVHQESIIEYNQSLVGNSWKLIYVTFNTPSSTAQVYGRFYFYPMTTTMTLNVYYVKLEKGKRPTPISISGDSVSTLIPTNKNGKLVLSAAPYGSGLYLGDSSMGYHDGSVWKTYMSNTGNFMLSGASASGNSLSWDGSSLNITGKVQATDGSVGGWNIGSNSLNSSDNSIIFHGTENYLKLFDDDGNMRFWANGATGSLPSLSGNTIQTYFNLTNIYKSSTNGATVVHNQGQYVSSGIGSTVAASTASYTIRFTKTGGSLYNAMVSATGESNGILQLVMQLYENGNLLKTSNSYYAETYGGTEWKSDGGGGGGGLVSVTADTEIELFDGTTKLAKNIKPGDKIKAWNWINGENQFIETDVSSIRHRTVSTTIRVITDSKVVYVSDSHGFWLDNNEEIKVINIVEGVDKIYVVNDETGNLELETVQKIEIVNSAIEVYTLSIDGVNNYISNGILSHNMSTHPNPIGGNSGYIFSTRPAYFPLNWNFLISANFVQGRTYEVKLFSSYTASSNDTTSLPVYYPGDSNTSVAYVNFCIDGTTITNLVQFIPSNTGLVVNGYGMRATTDSNNYLEVAGGTNSNSVTCSTKVAGNLYTMNGIIGPSSQAPGYGPAVKAFGLVRGSTTAIQPGSYNIGTWINGGNGSGLDITIPFLTSIGTSNYTVIATLQGSGINQNWCGVVKITGLGPTGFSFNLLNLSSNYVDFRQGIVDIQFLVLAL